MMLAAAFVLSGCGRGSVDAVQTVPEETAPIQTEAAVSQQDALLADVEALTKTPRPIGSEGEGDAAAYLESRFSEMGYTVATQTYTDDQGRTGTNVIATKAADTDADILVISAHHDSVGSAYGANDNASGVAALLAVAEAVKDLPTDTELRFISFTDEENGKNGSRFYMDSLPEAERERMIGDIQLDMLGGLGSQGITLCTTDGGANWLTRLLRKQDSGFTVGTETASDHTSFQLAEIPAVLVTQTGRGYLYHTIADTANHLDLDAVNRAAKAVACAVEEVISGDTPSYRETAREQAEGYTYRQTRQTVIYFGNSLKDTQAYIGAAGELTDHSKVAGNGWTDSYDTYRYSMRWFRGETPMNTYYRYRNGFLENIEIYPAETGYTLDEVRSLITTTYGQCKFSGIDRDRNPVENWEDAVYSKYLTLTELPETFKVTVSNYSVGLSNVLASYQVAGGQAEIADPEDARVWDFLCSILPLSARKKIAEFNLFTDGTSNILAYTSPIMADGKADNTRFAMNIDYYDVYDENGEQRDWSKLTYTILHEYGHVLLEDDTQIDLTVGKSTHDPKGFIEGSFRKAFYDRFWKGIGDSAVCDYEENSTNYVSRYGANYFQEDIADTFAIFILAEKPQGSTVAEEKLRLFWDDPAMTALRETIRENMGL